MLFVCGGGGGGGTGALDSVGVFGAFDVDACLVTGCFVEKEGEPSEMK